MILSGTPMVHQSETFLLAKHLDQYGLFWEPGCGKTYESIQFVRHKFNEVKTFQRTLIFCPPVVVKQWKTEFAKFSKVDQKRIILLKGEGKRRIKDFEANAWDKTDPKNWERKASIFVTNYESLLMKPLYVQMKLWAPQIIIWDEAHRLKNPSAKRTELAVELSEGVPTRYILTGTPVLNSPMDLFSQFEVLDSGQTFGRNFFSFRARFFVDRNAGMPRDRYFPNWQIRPGALEEINQLISRKTSVVRKADALDLPPLVRETIKIEMTPEQRRAYESMRRDLIAFIDSSEEGGEPRAVVATMALTKALRLLQIASGYAKVSDGEEIPLKGNPKAAALSEILEDIAPYHKVIVWAVFKQNYAQIREVCDKLKLKYVELHGEVSESQRQKNIEAFRSDPEVRVFLSHPGSGGIGVNLVEASYSVYFSRSFSLEHELQSEARNHRGGSEIHQKITRIDLICENSLEEVVVEKLANKEQISFELLKEIKGEI